MNIRLDWKAKCASGFFTLLLGATLMVPMTRADHRTIASHDTATDSQHGASESTSGSSKVGAQAQSVVTPQKSSDARNHFVTGVVTEEGTGALIKGAEIRVIVMSEQDPNKRVLKGVTDANGVYRIRVPMGIVWLLSPALKPGYWLDPAHDRVNLVTSSDQPVVEHNIVVRKGRVWNVLAQGEISDDRLRRISMTEEADDAKRRAWLNGEYVSWQESPAQSNGALNAEGRGVLTEVGSSGKWVIGVANMLTEFIVEPGFDNERVLRAERLGDSNVTIMTDAAGKKATIRRATVSLRDSKPLLIFRVEAPKPIGHQQLTGRVVDARGHAVAEVRVGVAMGRKNEGSGVLEHTVDTLADGKFELNVPIQSEWIKGADERPLRLALVLSKAGFAAKDTEWLEMDGNLSPIDVGIVTMSRGHAMPVRVVDESNRPLAGADLEPVGDYAKRQQAVRSDENGRAVIRNLPSGVVAVSVRWGTRAETTKLVVSENDEDNTETTIRLPATIDAQTNSQELVAIRVGSKAPEWETAAWTDGQPRKLADYRGRFVVLDFWGIWCSPCLSGIPAMQQLADHYSDSGVVFFGVHTADGSVNEVKKLKKLKKWTMTTGIDRGTSITDGVTCKTYGVRGYPTIVIIDRQGTIAYRSDIVDDRAAFMTKMAELAKSLEIAWPPSEDAPQTELESIMNRLQYAMLSDELDRLLNER